MRTIPAPKKLTTTGGAVGGAVVGAAVGGPFGIIPGAIIGGVGGWLFGEDKKDTPNENPKV